MCTTYTPRIYVGTYAKYNDGSIAGRWFDMEDYSDAEEFYAACQAFHGPGDHEFMFQDMEDIPEGMASESSIDSEFWDWLELDDSDKELLSVYREHVDQSGTIDDAREAYAGTHTSAADWAEGYLDETGALDSMDSRLRAYFDYESYARDAGFEGMTFADVSYREVWVFHAV